MIGREFYAWGYAKSGANGRVVGVILVDLALLAMFGMAVYGAAGFAKVSSLVSGLF
jgi:hypothetical protein